MAMNTSKTAKKGTGKSKMKSKAESAKEMTACSNSSKMSGTKNTQSEQMSATKSTKSSY